MKPSVLNEANFAAHAAWLPKAARAGIISNRKELLAVNSGTGSGTFNIVCRANLAGFTPAEAAALVRRVAGSYCGQPFVWWFGPASKPVWLPGVLEASGLEAAETELAMNVPVRNLRLPPPDRRIRKIGTADDVSAFAGVLARNWSPPDRAVEDLWNRGARRVLSGKSPCRLFAGIERGKVVATAELFVRDGTGGIYNVSTLRRYRGRGLGTAVTVAALQEAKRLGLRQVILQASEEGRGIYDRLGFRVTGRYVEYRQTR